MTDAFFTTFLVYPNTGPVYFLFWMLAVIALAIWWGMKNDQPKSINKCCNHKCRQGRDCPDA